MFVSSVVLFLTFTLKSGTGCHFQVEVTSMTCDVSLILGYLHLSASVSLSVTRVTQEDKVDRGVTSLEFMPDV